MSSPAAAASEEEEPEQNDRFSSSRRRQRKPKGLFFSFTSLPRFANSLRKSISFLIHERQQWFQSKVYSLIQTLSGFGGPKRRFCSGTPNIQKLLIRKKNPTTQAHQKFICQNEASSAPSSRQGLNDTALAKRIHTSTCSVYSSAGHIPTHTRTTLHAHLQR